MKNKAIVLIIAMVICLGASAQNKVRDESSGNFSLGTRNTISMFNDDNATGKGIGVQFRIQINDKLNTEWFFDYITSKNLEYTFRNDYHIGWSVMYYPGNQVQFAQVLQPYIFAGHCFDYGIVTEQVNTANKEERLSMATQAGLGTHLNITPRFDCSVSAQYMLHFGKEIETEIASDAVVIHKNDFSTPDGHLLFTISFNYKWADLW